jgi:solute carrier family 25 (mitochondrial phosphate transporter), member 23/24/25/41
VCTYPLDIVRTRLSIQSASFAALGDKPREGKMPGMWTTLVDMYKQEGGFAALYRGIIPTVAGVAPYVCLIPLRSLNKKADANEPLGRTKLYDL